MSLRRQVCVGELALSLPTCSSLVCQLNCSICHCPSLIHTSNAPFATCSAPLLNHAPHPTCSLAHLLRSSSHALHPHTLPSHYLRCSSLALHPHTCTPEQQPRRRHAALRWTARCAHLQAGGKYSFGVNNVQANPFRKVRSVLLAAVAQPAPNPTPTPPPFLIPPPDTHTHTQPNGLSQDPPTKHTCRQRSEQHRRLGPQLGPKAGGDRRDEACCADLCVSSVVVVCWVYVCCVWCLCVGCASVACEWTVHVLLR